MKKSLFLEIAPFTFIAMCAYCLFFEHFWFAAAFLVATVLVVLLEFSLFMKNNP